MNIDLSRFSEILAAICFGYPFVMAFYWMTGALVYSIAREWREPPYDQPPPLEEYPPVSVLVPCYNEEAQAEETFASLDSIRYPDFEIIAINDGSRDNTAKILEDIATRIRRMRVVQLASNQGKSTALNAGALVARHEILVCIDGDTLLDPNAVTWFVRRMQSDPLLGGMTGNPRIRTRSSLVGLLQVGEFSSIVGLIKRAQNVYGSLFTVSGAICCFRKRALADAGWWSRTAVTDDVDVSWRIQLAGWHLVFEPKALAWILMPETVRGLWKQRLRWSEGGSQVVIKAFPHMFRRQSLRMWPLWLNYLAAILWSYAMVGMTLVWLLLFTGYDPGIGLSGFSFLPQSWGLTLALTYLMQALLAATLDRKMDSGLFKSGFWAVWYPLMFWVMQAASAVIGLPKAMLRKRDSAGTWVSPDRGFR